MIDHVEHFIIQTDVIGLDGLHLVEIIIVFELDTIDIIIELFSVIEVVLLLLHQLPHIHIVGKHEHGEVVVLVVDDEQEQDQ